MQEWYIIPRGVDFLVSENVHTHPTTEVHSHVAAPSNSQLRPPPPPGFQKRESGKRAPSHPFLFLGVGVVGCGYTKARRVIEKKI